MFLLWLRVAAVLYAIASISALPAVLYNLPGWKRICVPAAVGAFFFHFVSLIEMLSAAHHALPAGMHEVQSLLGLADLCCLPADSQCSTAPFRFGIFALPFSLLLLVLGSAIGPDHWTFHFARDPQRMDCPARIRTAGGLCRTDLQHVRQFAVPGTGAQAQEQE